MQNVYAYTLGNMKGLSRGRQEFCQVSANGGNCLFKGNSKFWLFMSFKVKTKNGTLPPNQNAFPFSSCGLLNTLFHMLKIVTVNQQAIITIDII